MPHVHVTCALFYKTQEITSLGPSQYLDHDNLIVSQNTVLLIRIKGIYHENGVCKPLVTGIFPIITLTCKTAMYLPVHTQCM